MNVKVLAQEREQHPSISSPVVSAEKKSAKYSTLLSSHIFIALAVETLGPLADEAHQFVKDIGRRMML